jgi:serine/threonine protein phosphatase PrpC
MTGSCGGCGGPAGEGEEFCGACGSEVTRGRDHVERDIGPAAGVSDRGLRHARNEDAMALAAADGPGGPAVLAVVCDGVSSAPRADEASLVAARAAIGVLLSGISDGRDPAVTAAAAARAGAASLASLAGPSGAPAATYASAIVTAGDVTVCWLGDSRVYWLAADGAGTRCLTTDDSLAEEIVAAGLATAEQAMELPQAHVITRWLGADLPDPEAVLADPDGFRLPERGDRQYALLSSIAAAVAANPTVDRWQRGWRAFGRAGLIAPDVAAAGARALARARPAGAPVPPEVRVFAPLLAEAGLL